MYSLSIISFSEKVDVALRIAKADTSFCARILSQCRKGGGGGGTLSFQKSIANALGITPSTISNWVEPARRKLATESSLPPAMGQSAGKIVDFAGIMGFCADDETLTQRIRQFTELNELEAKPRDMYRVLIGWSVDTPACRCWHIFIAGTVEQFDEAYRASLSSLSPTLYSLNLSGRAISQRLPISPDIVVPPIQSEARLTLQLLDNQLPTFGRSEMELRAKTSLYGGSPSGMTMLEHASLGHSFPREAIVRLAAQIGTDTMPHRSYTVRAQRGAGLSLALAQLVQSLSVEPETLVRWIIGDPAKTKLFLEALHDQGDAVAALLRSEALQCGLTAKRMVIVLDDVSIATRMEGIDLVRFRNFCKKYFTTDIDFTLVIVFGIFGDAGGCHEFTEEIKLELTDKDLENCYQVMANTDPAIIFGHGNGLNGVLSENPLGRQISDDVELFVDWLLEYGGAIEPSNLWRARIKTLDSRIEAILIAAATVQLVGLALPWQIVSRLLNMNYYTARELIERAIQETEFIQEDNGEWPGVSISCPRRAFSVLDSLKISNIAKIEESFSIIIVNAIEISRADGSYSEMFEYTRHLLQRLFKPELYRFPGKSLVALLADRIFLQSVDLGWPERGRSKLPQWAGTLSPRLRPQVRRPKDPKRIQLAALVEELVRASIRDIDSGRGVDGATIVSLMRASRWLLKSKISEDADDRARAIAIAFRDEIFPKYFILKLIHVELSRKEDPTPLGQRKKDKAYRVNEIIHSAVKLDLEIGLTFNSWSSTKNWLDELEITLRDSGAPFDAGTWIVRAEFAIEAARLGFGTDAAGSAAGEAIEFLDRAEACIEFNPILQGTWGRGLKTMRENFDAT